MLLSESVRPSLKPWTSQWRDPQLVCSSQHKEVLNLGRPFCRKQSQTEHFLFFLFRQILFSVTLSLNLLKALCTRKQHTSLDALLKILCLTPPRAIFKSRNTKCSERVVIDLTLGGRSCQEVKSSGQGRAKVRFPVYTCPNSTCSPRIRVYGEMNGNRQQEQT